MSAKDTLFHTRQFINIRGQLYDLSTPKIMGILNVTPDSFHDGGLYTTTQQAFERAIEMAAQGADILDIGAQSTRPKADFLEADEEWARLKEIIPAIRKELPDAVLSIDTFWSEVARQAVDTGVDIINDISAGSLDENMFKTIAQLQVPYVLMHMQGTPKTMQENPEYGEIVPEVLTSLSHHLQELKTLGVNDVIIDPGFGFGKTVEQNYALLNRLEDFRILGLPVLAGVSRKSMINKALQTSPANALNGTTALHAFALDRGVNILRVHDVKEAREVVTLYQSMNA